MSSDPIAFSATKYLPGKVNEYAHLLDPQQWKRNIGALWKESGIVRGGKASPDRTKPPAVITSVDSWDYDRLFYEEVEFGGFSKQKNLLVTKLEKNPAPTKAGRKSNAKGKKKPLASIKFSYRQYECLESEYFEQKGPGGIDVDFGGAQCVQTEDDKVKLTVTKTVRFTRAKTDPLADLIARTSVKFVMELIVLGAEKQT
ncbi:MAG TPA: hypothetical protein VHL80_18130 [Polyangia bacterium]|nr:hypothetical protein [Polyangia bacterium]